MIAQKACVKLCFVLQIICHLPLIWKGNEKGDVLVNSHVSVYCLFQVNRAL